MTQSDPIQRRPGLWTAFAVTAVTAASAVTIALPSTTALADPATPTPATEAPAAPPATDVPPPPVDPNAPPPPPVDPNAPPPPPVDPNAPPPPADPNAPPVDPNAPPVDPNAPPPLEPGRIPNTAGGFSYLLPAGWIVSDASRLNYGQALLSKETGPSENGQPAPTANDTSVILGRLDLKLFAGAEQDNNKAAVRLASDMGEFFMPFPGVRINQQSGPLQAGDMPGYFSSYDVKFTDTSKPNGQIWAGVVGTAVPNAPKELRNQRWFVVWLGTGKDPIDPAAAKALAESIQPYAPPPPPPPPPPDPNAPPPDAEAPVAGGRVPVGVPVPVETPVPGMTPGQ
ncbi:APA family fibronectin-binding glycoprotein [Mycobacterium sp. CVI_P3]|uniref:Alanine and proline-rich secreted protein Apa n=1 Tax=Mycobacterium pinniadriaticum TaxID=2994102 RepID=A0ABT3S986_9MYCO|nr:APA family fibronectin-binding glycoprotein [Mycobacterium pinniadriaticum]MCX2929644.1 APA family fibronectin-binding glycoprotein [Mycobacterium pinniadriaticum]MCX2936068.1 APA family fibronectin-binding glycoprotein [Mycobacterium pinniadriaticum]